MSGMLKKRSHEDDALLFSPKRFHGQTEQQILHLFEDIEFGVEEQEEEVVSTVMRSLGQEIGVSSCCTSGLSRDASLASDMTSAYGTADGVIDLDYLFGVNLEDQAEATSSLKENRCDPCLDFAETAEIRGFAENWQFEDDFLDYGQSAVFEDWDVGALIDGDYSTPWGLETACGAY